MQHPTKSTHKNGAVRSDFNGGFEVADLRHLEAVDMVEEAERTGEAKED